MTYSLGTVFLDVTPSFDGLQTAAKRATRSAFQGVAGEAERGLREANAVAQKHGEKAGQNYGSAFEKIIVKRFGDIRKQLDSLNLGKNSGGKEVEKLRNDLDAITKMDLSKVGGRTEAFRVFRDARRDLNTLLDDAEKGGRRLSADTVRNLGAVRQQMGEVGRTMDGWNKPDPQAAQRAKEREAQLKREVAQYAQMTRAQREMNKELAERARLAKIARQQPTVDRIQQLDQRGRELKQLKIGVDIDGEDALMEAVALRAQIEALYDDAVEVDLDLDDTGLYAKTRATLIGLERTVGDKALEVTVAANAAQARSTVTQFQTWVRSLRADVQAGIDIDKGEALARIQAFVAQANASLERIDDVTVRANVERAIIDARRLARSLDEVGDEARKAGMWMRALDAGSAANSVRVFNGVLMTTLAIGPLLIPMLAGIAGGIMGVGLMAGAAMAGLGVFIAGVAGIGGAVKAMEDLAKARRQAAAQGKGPSSGTDTSGAVRDARAIEDAQRSLARTRRSASEAMAAANDRLRQSERDLVAAIEDGQERQQQARERVADAERALVDAQQDALRAQRDINEARAQAVRDLEDLNSQLANAKLGERGAQFALEEASVHYNVVLEDDQATDREKEVAKLAYEQAQQRLKDQQREAARLEEDAAKANTAGVEGSDVVVRAKERAADAVDGVAEAEQRVADANAEVAKAAEESAERVVAAQEKVRDAQEDAAKARRSAAESIADAERNLARTHEDIALAAGTAALAAQGLDTELFNLEEAMRGLTPEAREFAEFLYGLKPLLDEVRAAAQKGLLPGLQEAMQMLVDQYGPGFVDFVGRMAKVMGDLAVAAAEMFTSPVWQEFFANMSSMMPVLLEQFGQITGNFLTMLAGIGDAFAPFAVEFGEWLVEITDGWAKWGAELGDSAGFQGFMKYLEKNMPRIGELLLNLLEILVDLLVGLAPYADLLLEVAISFTEWLAAMEPEEIARIALVIGGVVLAVQMLAGALAAISGVAGLIGSVVTLGGAFSTLGAAVGSLFAEGGALFGITRALGAVAAAVTGTAGIIAVAVAAIVAGFVWAYFNIQGFRDGVDTVLRAIGGAFIWLWEHAIRPVVDFIVWAFDVLIRPVIEGFYSGVIQPTFGFIAGVFEVFAQVADRVFRAVVQIIEHILAPAFQWFYNNVIDPVFDAIGTAITWTWENVIRPVFEALRDFIEDNVAPVFRAAVEGLGNIWQGLLDLLRAPIRMVIQYVINEGLIGAFNWLADRIPGMEKLEEVKIPRGLQPGGGPRVTRSTGSKPNQALADGGVTKLPGYTPGRDVHRFVSPTGGVLDLSGGEGIARPEIVARIGERRWNEANKAARNGRVDEALGYLGGFANGGVVRKPGTGGFLDWIGDTWGSVTNWIGDKVGSVTDFIANPSKVLESVVRSAASGLGLPDSPMLDAGIGVAMAPIEFIERQIESIFGSGSEWKGDGGNFADAKAIGWPSMWEIVKAQFPNANLNSAFRPGAITAVGTPSMHGRGRAIDVTPSMDIFNFLAKTFPNSTELIYSPAGGRQLYRGKPTLFGEPTKSMHYDHVHWAMKDGGIMPRLYDQGGDLPPGLSLIANKTAKPEVVLTNRFVEELRDSMATQQEAPGMAVSFEGANIGYDPREVADAIARERHDQLALAGILDSAGGMF